MREEQASCFHLHRCCAIRNRSGFSVKRVPRKKSRGKVRCRTQTGHSWRFQHLPKQLSRVRVGFVVHGHQLPDARLRVALRGRKRCMAQKLLNGAQIRAIVQQVRGKSMP
jgi:hypothetical protein